MLERERHLDESDVAWEHAFLTRCAPGAIDFVLANRERPLADLAVSLWRSGRTEPRAMKLDTQRVTTLVAGYDSRRACGQTVEEKTRCFT